MRSRRAERRFDAVDRGSYENVKSWSPVTPEDSSFPLPRDARMVAGEVIYLFT